MRAGMDSSQLQAMAVWLSMFMLVCVMLILVVLWCLRLYRRWQTPRLMAKDQLHRWVLMSCVAGIKVQGPGRLSEAEKWMFLKSWLHLHLSLRGKASQRLTELGQDMGLEALAIKHMDSAHYAKRMVAMLTLGFLRVSSAVPLLRQRLQQGHSHSAIYAARALLEIDTQAHGFEVVQNLLDKEDIDLTLVAVMFKSFRPDLQTAMLSQWPDFNTGPVDVVASESEGGKLRWLHMARALELQLPSPLLEPLLHSHEDIDLLIAAIRLFQGEQGIEPLSKLAHHPDWRVRAQVARAYAYVGQSDTLPLLIKLSTDPEWWVRFRSAQALFRLPGVSTARILDQVSTTQDRYAIQMVDSVAHTLGRA